MKRILVPFCLSLLAFLPGSAFAAQPIEVTSLPDRRDLHGSVVVGDHLYVISGDEPMPKGFTNSVISARINPDRTLGPWTKNRDLPANLIFISNNAIVHDSTIYIVGGQEVEDIPGAANPGSEYKQTPNNCTISARVAPDGSIGEWTRSGQYPGLTGLGAAAATDGRFMYVTGGAVGTPGATVVPDPEVPAPAVFRAPILPDDSVGQWVADRPLPMALWNHCSFLHNGVLYTLGGRTGSLEGTITNKVLTSEVQRDGSLGPWVRSTSTLAYPVESASACAADDFLFLFCGKAAGGGTVNKIQYSQLTAEGISAWSGTETPISARCYSSAAVDRVRRSVYVSGGRFSGSYVDINDKVYCFPLRPSQASAQAAGAVASATSFLPLEKAMEVAKVQNKSVFLFVYSSDIAFSKKAFADVATSATFLKAGANVVLGYVDLATQPAAASKFGVYRVPTALTVSTEDVVTGMLAGRRSEAELAGLLK